MKLLVQKKILINIKKVNLILKIVLSLKYNKIFFDNNKKLFLRFYFHILLFIFKVIFYDN